MLQADKFRKFNRKLMYPRNDLATICHGDYTRNNILFEYDEDHQLLSSRILDFQIVRYAQPGTDLAIILALHTDPKDRDINLENYLHIYHNAVVSTIQNNSNIDISKYNYNRFLEDYSTHSFIGYTIISFFMPVMADLKNWDFGQLSEHINVSDTDEHVWDFLNNVGYGSEQVLNYQGLHLKHCIDMFERFGDNKILQ